MAVVKDYEAYWDAVLHASDPASPQDPGLAQYATGTALTDIKKAIGAQQRTRAAMRGTYSHKAIVASIAATIATVTDCLTADLTPITTGTTAPKAPATIAQPRYLPISASMVLQSGTWKIAKLGSAAIVCDASYSPAPALATPTRS